MGDNRKRTVLVVDDEPVNLTLISVMLEEQGYRVVTALGPIEALRIWRELRGDVDIVLTDMLMPEMTGCDLFYELRASKPDLPWQWYQGTPAALTATACSRMGRSVGFRSPSPCHSSPGL